MVHYLHLYECRVLDLQAVFLLVLVAPALEVVLVVLAAQVAEEVVAVLP